VKNIRTAGSAEKTGRLGKSGTGYIKKMLGMSFAPPIIFLAFAGRIDLDLELRFFRAYQHRTYPRFRIREPKPPERQG
jgi:hypothetical protein